MREKMKLRIKKRHFETFVDIMCFVIIYGFMASIFTPQLILSKTITSGGDTASHYLPAKYFIDNFLENGRLMGWFPGWYAGMPLFQNYFIPPFVLMALISYVTGLEIAFKLVTLSGILLTPLAAYLCVRILGYRFPAPIFSASMSLTVLFMENQSMWGGNIPATLAGEFSYMISMCLTLVLFARLYQGLKDGRFRASNAILFAMVALTHAYTVLWVIASTPFFLISASKEKIRDRLKYVFTVYPLAFMLTGFWSIPLMARREYMTAYALKWYLSEARLPPIIWPTAFLAFAALVYGLWRRDERVGILTFSAATCLILYHIAYPMGLVDIRFVPFIYAVLAVLSGIGLAKMSKHLKVRWLLAVIVTMSVIIWVSNARSLITSTPLGYQTDVGGTVEKMLYLNYTGYIPFWAQWNYEGFEAKPYHSQFMAVNGFLKADVAAPRAKFEHSAVHDKAGSVRAFESLPLFANRSIIEGLYIHSSQTAPFAFYLQSEMSAEISCPFHRQYQCTSIDIPLAKKHLMMFNTKYLVVVSPQVKALLGSDPDFEKSFEAAPFEVYMLKTNAGRYVTVPEYEPVVFQTSDWKNISYQWFKKDNLVDVPLVFVNAKEDAAKIGYKVVKDAKVSDLDSVVGKKLEADCHISEDFEAEKISFDTDCVGVPHIISVSYYPSWHVTGADHIYMVSPSFMMVVPTQKHVTLTYEKNPLDYASILVSVVGALLILYLMRQWLEETAAKLRRQ